MRLIILSGLSLASLLVAALPGVAPAPPAGPACSDTEDDGGWGGSHVDCRYSCTENNEIHIVVQASDTDASTYGNTTCGGQTATCNEPIFRCEGLSAGLTTAEQENAKCKGSSDEFWDSPVTVACIAIGLPDPKPIACYYVTDLCPLSPGVMAEEARLICLPADPNALQPLHTLDVPTLDELAGFENIQGFVSFRLVEEVGGVVQFLPARQPQVDSLDGSGPLAYTFGHECHVWTLDCRDASSGEPCESELLYSASTFAE